VLNAFGIVVVVQRDHRPRLGKPHRGSGPDPTTGAGDENNLIRELEKTHAHILQQPHPQPGTPARPHPFRVRLDRAYPAPTPWLALQRFLLKT
jgi:hypothetical protein